MTNTPLRDSFDMIVLGGGIVGLTTALLCAQKGFTVAIVETHTPKLEWENEHYDIRVSAITRASEKIFQRLKIWESMQSERISAYQRVFVWDALGYGEIAFDAAEVGEPDLGHIIENRVIIKALWRVCEAHDNLQFFLSQKPVAIQETNDQRILYLEDGQTLKASLIVGSDGAKSWVRETLAIETRGWDYQQSALVATITTELPHQETAWQRFLPEGPVALLPLPQPHLSSIVWTSTPETTEAHLQLDNKDFCAALAQAVDYRLGAVMSVENRQKFPLRMGMAKHPIGPRAVIIGDAAHVIHPLAGQGVNLGLCDAECLADVLSKARQKDYDIGQHLILRRYERARAGETLMMIAAMEFFKRLFAGESSTKALLRSASLNFTNKNKWLKKKMIRQAMGI